jgi:alkylation response protein AidB-like acyl-CoA dehydrogenase
LVDPQSSGVTPETQITTNQEFQARLTLAGAPATPLGDVALGTRAIAWLHECAVVGLCAMQLGVAERAVQMTGEYTNRREQFGRPLASFQAVHQRAADAYIDVEAMRVTLWQAAWRLAEGVPASAEVAVAKFWASEDPICAVYAAQQFHGIGVDVDPPPLLLSRSKQIELSLGSRCASSRGLAR